MVKRQLGTAPGGSSISVLLRTTAVHVFCTGTCFVFFHREAAFF